VTACGLATLDRKAAGGALALLPSGQLLDREQTEEYENAEREKHLERAKRASHDSKEHEQAEPTGYRPGDRSPLRH
jgi:hypothetical protein